MKVYCKDCKYLHEEGLTICECTHPLNMEIVIKENWYERKSYNAEKKPPFEINRNNDCSWYKSKSLSGW